VAVRAGFAEVDITPPVGTLKIGWLRKIVSTAVVDPLFARLAVLESGGERIGFVQLDTLSVRWSFAQLIRRRLAERYGLPGGNVMVSATHNHAGPAVANVGEVPRDEGYCAELADRIVAAFGEAVDRLGPVELGFANVTEWTVSHNRRFVTRDGTCLTHARPDNPSILFVEGPIDPELAVIAARRPDGALAGLIVNFTCHPVHLGGGPELSAGYPGFVAQRLKESAGSPVSLFLNGACGNISPGPASQPGGLHAHEIGGRLVEDVRAALAKMTFRADVSLGVASRSIDLPYRRVTDDEARGRVRGAQRFINPALYDAGMPALLERIRTRKVQPAEVQVLFLGEWAVVGIPAEYFVEHGLRIKERAYPLHALISSCTNGMVGYVPTRAAFARGGYETTLAGSSRLAPEAGDLLADCAIELIEREKPRRVPAAGPPPAGPGPT